MDVALVNQSVVEILGILANALNQVSSFVSPMVVRRVEELDTPILPIIVKSELPVQLINLVIDVDLDRLSSVLNERSQHISICLHQSTRLVEGHDLI